MALQNFIDRLGPVVAATWLNAVDLLKETIFENATTKAQARTNLMLDAPLEVTNGGTGSRLGATPYYETTSAEVAAGITPTNKSYLPGDVRRYGTVGTADDSAVLQACVNGNKGGLAFIPAGITVTVAGVLLSGSGYDNTKLLVEGILKLKVRPSAGTNNFGGAWVGIIVQSCANVVLDILDFDGNRAAQPDEEHCHLVGIAGASNWRIPRFFCRELRGDGIYISQANWTSNSTNSSNGRLGLIDGVNSASDGRNLVSVISCDGLKAASIYSRNIGGIVGGVQQPGGVDLEPNATYQSVNDVVIGEVDTIQSAGNGLSVLGKAVTNDATRDWNIQRVTIGSVRVRLTGSTSLSQSPAVLRARDVAIPSFSVVRDTAGTCAQLDYLDRIRVAIDAYNGITAIYVGYADYVYDFDIRVNVGKYTTTGLDAQGVTRGRFSGRVTGAATASDTFAIRVRPQSRTITQTSVVYAVDAPYDGNNVRAFRNQPGDAGTLTFGAGTCARDCDWSGYTSFSVQCDGQIPTFGVTGRNISQATAQPASGNWALGDVVYNFGPSAGEVLGWMRLTNGSTNVADTDWTTIGTLKSANAYTPTNVTTDRSYDADTVAVAELADVVGTLIADLQSSGVLK